MSALCGVGYNLSIIFRINYHYALKMNKKIRDFQLVLIADLLPTFHFFLCRIHALDVSLFAPILDRPPDFNKVCK